MESGGTDLSILVVPSTPVMRTCVWFARWRARLFLLVPLTLVVLAHSRLVNLWVGSLLVLVGTLFRFWGSGYLEKNLRLTTEGPYRLVRHPLYLGSLLIVGGWCLMNGQWLWAIGNLLYASFLFGCSMIWEEYRLLHLFPSYKEYRAAVPLLIPTRFHLRSLGLTQSHPTESDASSGSYSWGRVWSNGEPRSIFWSWLVVLLFWGKFYYGF